MQAISTDRTSRRWRAAFMAAASALVVTACSAAPESQSDGHQSRLAAHAPASGSSGQRPTSGVTGKPAGPHETTIATAASQAGGTGPATELRCEQLRQDGVVWERTRKLALRNRGEAGARVADLNTPWTKDNVTFYLASCQSRKNRTTQPAQAQGRTAGSPG